MVRLLLCLAACALVLAFDSFAFANAVTPAPAMDATRSEDASPLLRRSRSIGYPRSGRLLHGSRLRPSRYVQYTDEVSKSGHAWGTWELVQLVERAAFRVAGRHRGKTQLYVGELSKKKGGRITGHRSHQNGRDVDLAFYSVNPRGQSHRPNQFVRFSARGLALAPHKHLRFDDSRNWELVAKLVADGDAKIQHIFVSKPVRQRLLKYAKHAHAHPVVLERARRVLAQPTRGHRHDNHFHVRIYCPPGDRPQVRRSGSDSSVVSRESNPASRKFSLS